MAHTAAYDRYITGKAWENRRRAFFSKYSKQCWRCSIKHGQTIHLHHHTYIRFTHELDEDLVPLCEPCHMAVHAFHREHQGIMSLTEATKTMVESHPDSLGMDITLVPKKRTRACKGEPTRKQRRKGGTRRKQLQRREARDARVRRDGMIPVRDVASQFGVFLATLRRQGYQKTVPPADIKEWTASPPDWLIADQQRKKVLHASA